jgi:hypothetical protein
MGHGHRPLRHSPVILSLCLARISAVGLFAAEAIRGL